MPVVMSITSAVPLLAVSTAINRIVRTCMFFSSDRGMCHHSCPAAIHAQHRWRHRGEKLDTQLARYYFGAIWLRLGRPRSSAGDVDRIREPPAAISRPTPLDELPAFLLSLQSESSTESALRLSDSRVVGGHAFAPG